MPECLRCGECCRKNFQSVVFYDKDLERLDDELWVGYYPFFFSILGNIEMESAAYFGCHSVKHAWFMIREAERKFEKENFGMKIEIPYGGSLTWCPFLEHKGDVWGCLIHEIKPDTCRKYFCEHARS